MKVKPVEQTSREFAKLKLDGKRADRTGQQFIDQALGQRLGRVDEDELGSLLLVRSCDERGNADREAFYAGVADGRAALLAIDDPSWLVLLRAVLADRDRKCPVPGIGRARRAGEWLELNAFVKGNDESIRDHGRIGLDIPADRVDVGKHRRALVALDLRVVFAVDP